MPAADEIEIPGFRIERELGRGAMGVVYLAHELALQREVALKVLRAGFGDDEELRARFGREVRAAARLRHPHIVPVLSTGETQGRLWYAMQFVAGATLDHVLQVARDGRIPVARAARIARDVARALHAAHEAGVTHRDVKPGNVLLVTHAAPEAERGSTSRRLRRSWLLERSPRGGGALVDHPLLADFGLAADRTSAKLSESGLLIGTPGFMAPEQFRGAPQDVGPHSDQWALGAVLYECVTGRTPFPTADLPTMARLVTQEEPIAPSRLDAHVDRDLETIVLTCLQKNPRDRYPSCAALADDLGRWLREEPIAARPPGPLRRVLVWGRKRPAQATALVGVVLGLLVAAAVVGGLHRRTVRRTAQLRDAAALAMREARWDSAEQLYEEWIALDPGAAPPRDGRARARALRGVFLAQDLYERAQEAMAELASGRERLARLEEEVRLGQAAAGGAGLGAGQARGSEPWWMREPAYAAKHEIERVQREVVRLRAQVASTLAVARSLVAANVADAGERGRQVQRALEVGAAAWHMEQWRDAQAGADEERAALHRLAVEQLDPRPYATELSGVRAVEILPTDPPSEAWLFRYENEADVVPRGGPRWLPLPCAPDGAAANVPTAYVESVAGRFEGEGRRRVAPDVPTISPRLQSSEGYVETLGGRLRRDRYEALLASSAYPLEAGASNALGRIEAPLDLHLPPGRYLLLLRPRDRAEQRLPFVVDRTSPAAVVLPGPLDLVRAPDGFVPIPATQRATRTEAGFLAARYEVTYADYWAFLNDPRTLEEIEAHRTDGLRFVPRSEGRFERPEDGALPYRPAGAARYLSMDNPEHPVAHLCLYDLVGYLTPPEGEDEPRDEQYNELDEALQASGTVGWGYLRWRTERSQANAREAARTGAWLPDVALVATADGGTAPRALRFTLPTEREWVRMAGGDDGRAYPYGNEREWTYFKGARSRPYNPAPEAVGLFPEDESAYGVRDLAGSVAEWTADWVESGGVFWVKGHSWGSQQADDDRIDARRPLAPSEVSSTVGVRLIVRVLE